MVGDDGISKTVCNPATWGCSKMNQQNIVILFFSVLVLCIGFSCKTTRSQKPDEIVNIVGEIFPDSISDNKNFNLCGAQDQIVQYYAFPEKTYKGEKSALIEHFQKGYEPVQNSKESGLIRIRFVVNCKGEAGRFRLLSMDSEYQPKEFSKKITAQLLTLTQKLTGWKAMQARGNFRDYYQYLVFKIENGELIEIMP